MNDDKQPGEAGYANMTNGNLPKWIDGRLERMVRRSRAKLLANGIGLILLLAFLYWFYMVAVHMYFNKAGRDDAFLRAVFTAAELNGDGVQVEKSGVPAIEVTPFLTQKTTLKLYRYVGEWQVISGEIQAKRSLSGKLDYSVAATSSYLNDLRPSFILPSSIMSEGTMKDRKREESALDMLGQIGDGHVAELSFSANRLMAPEELLGSLEDYDLAVTGMPVYAGELKQFEIAHSLGGGTDYYVPHLTLKPRYGYEEDDRLFMWQMHFKGKVDIAKMQEHVDGFLSDLERLTEYSKYHGEEYDQLRLAYLRENGVQVYGATVTGPVRELEKLKERPEFREFRLGRIEAWNWK